MQKLPTGDITYMPSILDGMFCPDEDEAFSVQKFLIILSENLVFPFGMNVACVRACILCIWPNTDMYHQFAIAKYILFLGEPFSEQ